MHAAATWQSMYFPRHKFSILQKYIMEYQKEAKHNLILCQIKLEHLLSVFDQCFIALYMFKYVDFAPLSKAYLIVQGLVSFSTVQSMN